MDYQSLKSSVQEAPAGFRPALERLLLYVSCGDGILPEYERYFEEAESYRDFFEAVYADDERKETQVWAEWARFARKNWLLRFKPDIAISKIRIKTDGIPIGFESGVMLAPTGIRDNVANLFVFSSNAFNTLAAEFVTSIGGSFTCAGLKFMGIYGVYNYLGNVILEAWEVEKDPEPSDGVM